MEKLITFHGDPAIKEKYLTRLRLHRAQDEIIQGVYWENGKGCAVGCTIHASTHQAYEDELGISRIIATLEDRIFEGLPNILAKDFPIDFLEAVPVGVDIGIVFYQFMRWLLVEVNGVIQYVQDKKIITDVADLFDRHLKGEKVKKEEWERVADAARTYASVYIPAEYASEATANAANAAYAIYAAADAASYASDGAADYSARVAAGDAIDYATSVAVAYANAANATWGSDAAIKIKQSEKLIELIKECA